MKTRATLPRGRPLARREGLDGAVRDVTTYTYLGAWPSLVRERQVDGQRSFVRGARRGSFDRERGAGAVTAKVDGRPERGGEVFEIDAPPQRPGVEACSHMVSADRDDRARAGRVEPQGPERLIEQRGARDDARQPRCGRFAAFGLGRRAPVRGAERQGDGAVGAARGGREVSGDVRRGQIGCDTGAPAVETAHAGRDDPVLVVVEHDHGLTQSRGAARRDRARLDREPQVAGERAEAQVAGEVEPALRRRHRQANRAGDGAVPDQGGGDERLGDAAAELERTRDAAIDARHAHAGGVQQRRHRGGGKFGERGRREHHRSAQKSTKVGSAQA